jgi:hypothetical protein
MPFMLWVALILSYNACAILLKLQAAVPAACQLKCCCHAAAAASSNVAATRCALMQDGCAAQQHPGRAFSMWQLQICSKCSLPASASLQCIQFMVIAALLQGILNVATSDLLEVLATSLSQSAMHSVHSHCCAAAGHS